ncbi:polymorphic toxin type 27 domain-containing protein [Streptomyces canus]|uniref:polymorphic toxin type 27 domain-containing protein n=1 Tax=Streptomyces canus TaxID=58343 RepID=UPI00386E7BBD
MGPSRSSTSRSRTTTRTTCTRVRRRCSSTTRASTTSSRTSSRTATTSSSASIRTPTTWPTCLKSGARTFNNKHLFDRPHPNSDGRPIWMVAVDEALEHPRAKISISLDGVPDAKNAADALERLIARGRPLVGSDWRPAAQSGNGTAWEMATLRLKVINGKRQWTDFDWYMTKPGEKTPSLVTDMPVPDWAT